jgi:hypothetical protein
VIKRQGGQIHASEGGPHCIVVAGEKKDFRLKNLIEKDDSDVIDYKYRYTLIPYFI